VKSSVKKYRKRRREVFERDGHVCKKCKETEPLTVHHILEKTNGGTNEINNLVTLCEKCHVTVHKLKRKHRYQYIFGRGD